MTDGYIHVSTPRITGYLVRVRKIGCQNYVPVDERHTKEQAYALLAEMMAGGDWKRGDVLALPASPGYEPSRCVEMVHG